MPQIKIRESDLTSEVPPELIPDGTINPALLMPAVNINQPPQTTDASHPMATGDSALNRPGPISPPGHRGNGLDPSPAPLTPSDSPETEDDAVEAMIHEFLNLDENETRAGG